ncbi:MAG: hypothetical protein ACI8RZ_001069 [Myxococcota bacterium]|jgi:hypothetical protein
MMSHLILLTALTGCVVNVTTDSDSVEFDEPVVGIVTDLGAGDVTITGANTVGAMVYRDLEWSGSRPDIDAWVEDGILYLTADCTRKVVCQAHHDVVVSEAIWSDIMTGAGNVSLRGLDEGARAETGSGDISMMQVYGDITAETGSGAVTIEDSIGDLDLSTGSGDVTVREAMTERLALSTGSGQVDVDIREGLSDADVSTGSGDVTLMVPSGSYSMSISTGSGDVDLANVTETNQSDRRIEISTGSGDVEVMGQ